MKKSTQTVIAIVVFVGVLGVLVWSFKDSKEIIAPTETDTITLVENTNATEVVENIPAVTNAITKEVLVTETVVNNGPFRFEQPVGFTVKKGQTYPRPARAISAETEQK